MVNQINEAIEVKSIAQSFAQNVPICAHLSAFYPHSKALSSSKHTARKAGFGFVNRRSPVQARASAPFLQKEAINQGSSGR